MKINKLIFVAICAAVSLAFSGCTRVFIIECVDSTESDNQGGQDDESGLGTNLVAFHASVESLNMTKSMSPISADTRVLVFAYHGSTDNATSMSAVARGTYIAQQAGTLTGDSGYKMLLSNGTFDLYTHR